MRWAMVEFNIKVHEKQGIAYIPKEIRECMGLEFKLTANRTACVLYPKNARLEDVVKSLRIILQDLEHALEMKDKRS